MATTSSPVQQLQRDLTFSNQPSSVMQLQRDLLFSNQPGSVMQLQRDLLFSNQPGSVMQLLRGDPPPYLGIRGPQFRSRTLAFDRFSKPLTSILSITTDIDLTSTGTTALFTLPDGVTVSNDVTTPSTPNSGTFTFGGGGGNGALIDNTTVAGADPSGVNSNTNFAVDLVTPQEIRQLEITKHSPNGITHAITWSLQYSDDAFFPATSWTPTGETFVNTPGTSTVPEVFTFSTHGAHRHWRFRYQSGTTGGNVWIRETEWKTYSTEPPASFAIIHGVLLRATTGGATADATVSLGINPSTINLFDTQETVEFRATNDTFGLWSDKSTTLAALPDDTIDLDVTVAATGGSLTVDAYLIGFLLI